MADQSTEVDKKHIACLGCRIRRRKCDGLKPICSGCVDLNIPVRLCVYHDARVGYKSDKAEKALEKLKRENKSLKNELQRLKRMSSVVVLSNDNETVKHPRRRSRYEPYLLPSDLSGKSLKNLLTGAIGESSGTHIHYGPISWYAIASTNEPLKNISAWFINTVKLEKERYDRSTADMRQYEKSTALMTIKELVIDHSLRIHPTDKDLLIQDLLVEIGNNLPSKELLTQLLAYYFHINSQRVVGFVYVDEEQFYDDYNKYLSFDSKGKVKILSSANNNGVPFIMLLLALLTFTGYSLSRTIEQQKEFQVDYMLMVEYLKTLLMATGLFKSPVSFSFFPSLCPVSLIALIHLAVFERCSPHGKRLQGIMGITDFLTSKQLVIYAKMLHLDKDIDIYYSSKSENYKKGLKSIWTCLIYHDISEGLETGIDLKIKPEELVQYEYDPSPYARSLVVLNRVLNQFNEKVVEITGFELTDYIEKKLVSQLDEFLSKDLTSAASDLQYFRACDFDDTSNAPKYVYLLQMAAIKLLFYSLSQSLYQFCAKMAEQYKGNWRRYELLAIKKGATLMQYLKDTMEATRRLILHENAKLFSLVSTLQVLFKPVTFSLRRCTLFAGDLSLRKSNQKYNFQVLHEMTNHPHKYAKSLMKASLPSKRYEIFSYTVQDLEDLEVEKDMDLMKQKLGHLFESRFLIFKLSRMIHMVAKALDNDKFNLNFVKLNYVFFYCSSASNLFLSLAYPQDGHQKNGTSTTRSHADINHQSNPTTSTSSLSSISTEFNFSHLFKTCIDTTSENFDFKTFFTGSTDLYQNEELDEFFKYLNLPLSDEYDNSNPF